jgi:hypothetical protein
LRKSRLAWPNSGRAVTTSSKVRIREQDNLSA